MANQVSIPFKKTSPVRLDTAVQAYIQMHHTDTHPDEFKEDIKLWEDLRRSATSLDVHVTKIPAYIKYHAQLTFILTKLPPDIGLEIQYSGSLRQSSPLTSISNLAYERVAILYNLAALYSHLALAEDRTHADGIKRANTFYQNAAGTLSYLIATALPPLVQSLDESTRIDELSEPLLRSLEYLMLAQAQEGAWQRALMDRFKNGTIAKLSAKVASYYRMSGNAIRDAPAPVQVAFPSEWLAHIETKQCHFEAAAQYRKSSDDSESNQYGHELARLFEAQALSKRGYDLARRSYVAKPVLGDIKTLSDMVQTRITLAERDNDLIYHQVIPPLASIPVIQEASMVKSTVPAGLQDPKSVIGNETVIFGDLVGWGARVAVEIFHDRRENWLKEEVYDRVTELDLSSNEVLEELKLPASLDALDRPVGLPPSLLRKVEDVRNEDGPSRIEGSLSNVELLAERNRAILNEAMDILDQEASEDEGIRKSYASDRRPLDRPPSFEANVELSGREKRYRQMLEQAAASDETVRTKWNEWEEAITRLTWDEPDIEQWVPSSTISTGKGKSPVNAHTLGHARSLRVLLEALDDNRNARHQLASRARRLAEADDIRPRIMRQAAGIERWTEVEPAMFEDTLDQEMSKYDKFKDGIEEGASKQAELLDQIKSKHEQFILSRKDDRSIKERERALQSLDLAFHKYREITRNLDEGLQFYNDLGNILLQFRDACKEWVRLRRDELRQLSLSLDRMRLDGEEEDVVTPTSSTMDIRSSIERRDSKAVANNMQAKSLAKVYAVSSLPPPDSNEWEEAPLPSRKTARTAHHLFTSTTPGSPAR